MWNAVAISNKFALTALHGHGELGSIVSLRDIHGRLLSAKVVHYSFVQGFVDIVAVELTGEEVFPAYINVDFNGVALTDEIVVVGIKVGAADESMTVAHKCSVTGIENGAGSAMFQSAYTSFCGLSGAGVVTRRTGKGFKVVGVHVGAHDDTEKYPELKKVKKENDYATVDQVNRACTSLASSIHGHHAFCLICEVARVPELVDFLHNNGVE